MVGCNAQDIAFAGLAEHGFDLSRAIHTVRGNEGERHLCGDRARDHPARDLGLSCKTHFVRHMRRLQALEIVRPFFRQIERPIDEGMAVARHVGSEHADLAIGDLARRTRLVDDKNCSLVGERFQRVIAYDVAQYIGIPSTTAQDRLLTPRAGIAGRLCAHPTRLAPLITKQTIQKQARRSRHAFLAEQKTHPRFDIPQRRRP